jgi:hypothetical protein
MIFNSSLEATLAGEPMFCRDAWPIFHMCAAIFASGPARIGWRDWR